MVVVVFWWWWWWVVVTLFEISPQAPLRLDRHQDCPGEQEKADVGNQALRDT